MRAYLTMTQENISKILGEENIQFYFMSILIDLKDNIICKV